MKSHQLITELMDPADLPADLYAELIHSPDGIHKVGEKLFLLLEQKVVCLPDNPAGRELAGAIRPVHSEGDSPACTAQDVFFRLLTEPGFPDGLIPVPLRTTRNRAVVAFRRQASTDTDFFQIFSGIAPVEEKDIIVRMDIHTVALIKDLQDQSAEDLAEFCEAVIGTMESEGTDKVRAGVGGIVSGPQALHESYSGALCALDLSDRYHLHGSVSVFDRLQLERMLDCISPEAKTHMKNQLLSGPPDLSPELKETVAVFFQNDLNMTAAARDLFIHRNTLNYRLDKIRKEFGLDLRSFRDAAVYMILSEISSDETNV